MRLKKFTKPIEHATKRAALRFLMAASNPATTDTETPPSFSADTCLLFIRLNKIGDALVTTPLLQAVKRTLGCRITVLADRRNSFVFKDCPHVDRVITFRKGLAGMLAVQKLTKQERFDAVIDCHDDVSTTVTYLVAMAHAKYKFGLKRPTEEVYTHTTPRPSPASTHIVDRLLALGSLLGVPTADDELNINYQPTDKSIANAERFLEEYLPNRKFLVGINISAGSVARFWGVDRFRKLVALFEEYGVSILILTIGRDIDAANAIADGNHPVYCTGDFNQFAAMISQLDFLFTPDTSIVHLGSAYRIPQFGIYVKYQTTDHIWSPYLGEFDCVVTEEGSFVNLEFETVAAKLRPFFAQLLPDRP